MAQCPLDYFFFFCTRPADKGAEVERSRGKRFLFWGGKKCHLTRPLPPNSILCSVAEMLFL